MDPTLYVDREKIICLLLRLEDDSRRQNVFDRALNCIKLQR